jgi:DNA-binding PadR family transcriptional regulator
MTRNDPELTAMVCLAIVDEEPQHGWAIVKLLASDGAIGKVWSVSRPLTYRALDSLEQAGLIEPTEAETSERPGRIVYTTTESGRKKVSDWLSQPVALPRDVRTELLLKFVFRRRRKLSISPLAKQQRDLFAPMMRAEKNDDVVALWRAEHLQAIDRFLQAVEESK